MANQVPRILHELIVAAPATQDDGIDRAGGNGTLSKQRSIPAATHELQQRLFTIRTADEDGRRSAARILVNRLYTERGYNTSEKEASPLTHAPKPAITLVIQEQDTVVGTLSVGIDGPWGLLVDELYAGEVRALREQGFRLCEFIKLGIDQIARSKRLLASLFHTAFLYARELHGCDHVVVEVNPRHVEFYRRILGFAEIGPRRNNPRVDAPAVLLCLDLRHTQEQLVITQDGGAHTPALIKAFYKSGFSIKEQEAILRRMRSTFRAAQESNGQNATPSSP